MDAAGAASFTFKIQESPMQYNARSSVKTGEAKVAKTPPAEVAAYILLEFCGSIARPKTFNDVDAGRPASTRLQFVPPSVLLYNPCTVPAYTVIGF